jgi:uncharacterized Zn finger protein
MIKVLAAEMSDQGRLSRGKRYWADDAVIDIVIGHGAVTAEVQGGRPQPYVVTLEAAGGSGVPAKRELWVQCTCPDDTGTGAHACKHAVAAMFTLADEVAIEPELVDRWRQSARAAREHSDVAILPTRDDALAASEHEAGHEADVIELRPRRDPDLDAIAVLLRAPAGAAPPDFGDVDPIEHTGVRNQLLAEVLDDALDHLAIRWE